MALNPLFLISANPLLAAPLIALLLSFAHINLPLRLVSCEDATRFLTWNVAYTNMSILGNKPKQVTNRQSADHRRRRRLNPPC
jgi:hypothetical protein